MNAACFGARTPRGDCGNWRDLAHKGSFLSEFDIRVAIDFLQMKLETKSWDVGIELNTNMMVQGGLKPPRARWMVPPRRIAGMAQETRSPQPMQVAIQRLINGSMANLQPAQMFAVLALPLTTLQSAMHRPMRLVAPQPNT